MTTHSPAERKAASLMRFFRANLTPAGGHPDEWRVDIRVDDDEVGLQLNLLMGQLEDELERIGVLEREGKPMLP